MTLFTTETKIVTINQNMREFLWFRRLVKNIVSTLDIEIQKNIQIKNKVFENNNNTLILTVKTGDTSRTKHIYTKYWFFKKHISEDKSIGLRKIDTLDQIVNIFIKGVKRNYLFL